MDELDIAILEALQDDARQTNKDIARALGVAPSTCHERIRTLVRRGIIRGFHAEIDLTALNRGVEALISVQIRPLHRAVIDSFQEFTDDLPEILSSFVLAGQDDFVLHVAVQDLDHLHAFLIDRLSKRKEVAGFRTSVVYRHARTTTVSALEDPTRHGAGDAGGSTPRAGDRSRRRPPRHSDASSSHAGRSDAAPRTTLTPSRVTLGRREPGPSADMERCTEFTPPRDEQVHMLLEGADTLRRILRTRVTEEIPYEFVFMSVAHLLEELARSVRAGQDPSEHTVDAALEITRHLRHRNP